MILEVILKLNLIAKLDKFRVLQVRCRFLRGVPRENDRI